MSSLYCVANSRSAEQTARMTELEAAGICLFCPDGLAAFGSEVLFANASWSVLDNDFPYAGTVRHLLLVPRAHVLDLLDLDPGARDEFWEALAAAKALGGRDFYGVGARNGDCAATGATIAHLHLHFLVPDPSSDGPPVRMRFSGR